MLFSWGRGGSEEASKPSVPTVRNAPRRLAATSKSTVCGFPNRRHQSSVPTVWMVILGVQAARNFFCRLRGRQCFPDTSALLRKYEDLPYEKATVIQYVIFCFPIENRLTSYLVRVRGAPKKLYVYSYLRSRT